MPAVALLGLLVAAAATAAPATPLKTTAAKLRAHAHPVGARVEVAAVVLPVTAIQVGGAGSFRYFALAVPAEAPFFTEGARVLEEVRAVAPGAYDKLAAVVEDDQKYRAEVTAFGALLERVEKAAAPPSDALAVQLQGFGAVASAYQWQTVITSPGLITFSPLPEFAFSATVFRVADGVAQLEKLAAARPPALKQKLPDYAGSTLFANQQELDAYRAMVRAYNTELVRRRHYVVQLSRDDMTVALARLERILSAREDVLRAGVIARDSLAARTFEKAHSATPTVWLREAAPKGKAVVDRKFAGATLLLASYPTGAAVTVDGQDAGLTPVLLPERAVGSELRVVLSQPGFATREATQKVSASPTGVQRVELVLDPAASPAPPK